MSCLLLSVDTFIGLIGKAIFNIVAFQLGCFMSAVCVPITCLDIMLPVLGFAPFLETKAKVG